MLDGPWKLVTGTGHLLLIGMLIFLSPLCIFSSQLLTWTTSWIVREPTLGMMWTLLVEATGSTFLTIELMRERSVGLLFFQEFVGLVTFSNSAAIGAIYSLLDRQNLWEEVGAKVAVSLASVTLGEMSRNLGLWFLLRKETAKSQRLEHFPEDSSDQSLFLSPKKLEVQTDLLNRKQSLSLADKIRQECIICSSKINRWDWIFLSCGHSFHQSCLWAWIQTHRQCPICRLPLP